MAKPTLAWIDHSYHQKTKSSFFLKNLLAETFSITEYWDDSWQGGAPVPAADINKHDYAFFLQVLSPADVLKDIRVPMLWAPMYDGEKFNYGRWKAIAHYRVKVLAFSRKIADWAARFSIPTMTVQYYYVEPPQERASSDKIDVLFWYRGGIGFDDVRRILDPKQVNSLTLVDSPDGTRKPLAISDEDKAAYRIRIITDGFMPRDKYMSFINEHSVFVAPRKKEGIGAFTEPLALGKCVVAYDDAVHNEYITHGTDGLLFTEKTGKLDLSHADELGSAAWKRAQARQKAWHEDKGKIAPFLMEQAEQNRNALPVSVWLTVELLINLWRKARYYAKTAIAKISR